MQVFDLTSRQPDLDSDERASLEQQVRSLKERLAFYEGFDVLIQDNVAHARELFRLAAQEREAAATKVERARKVADQREATLRAELAAIDADVKELARAADALSQRVARALGEPARDVPPLLAVVTDYPTAVVVHGVPSARTALSLQRFVGALPQVSEVAAREFAGGVLRLDARVRDRLRADQFSAWEDPRGMQLLTERPDVIEFALERPLARAID
jgi:hypothetical protein